MKFKNKKYLVKQKLTPKLSFLSILMLFIASILSCSGENNDDNSEYITIGTFNIAWLGDGIDDMNPRDENDYKNIAEIIKNSGVDILGLEEIENDNALSKVIKYLPGFKYYVGNKSGSQNPALLFKDNIQVTELGYFQDLEVVPNKTKPGLLFHIKKRNFDWLMMVVHFKSTSRYDSTDELKELSRVLRTEQASALSNWIDSIVHYNSEKDLIIVGDFNDYPTRITNPTLTVLDENNNINFLSSELKSCKYEYLYSIDHIIVSNSAKHRLLPNSIRMYNFFNALTSKEAEKISDHCPVLATFNISLPDND